MIVEDTRAAEVATSRGPMRSYLFRPAGWAVPGAGAVLEIFQVTGPVAYDQAGADKGNAHKTAKEIASYLIWVALDEFFGWNRASDRGPFRKALVREAGDNALLAPELAAGITKVKAPQRAVRIGNWLEQANARELPRAPTGEGKKAIRDRAQICL